LTCHREVFGGQKFDRNRSIQQTLIDWTEINDHIAAYPLLKRTDGLIELLLESVKKDIVKHQQSRSVFCESHGISRRRRRRKRRIRVDDEIKVLREINVDATIDVEFFLLKDKEGWNSMLWDRETGSAIMDDKVCVPVRGCDFIDAAASKRCVCQDRELGGGVSLLFQLSFQLSCNTSRRPQQLIRELKRHLFRSYKTECE